MEAYCAVPRDDPFAVSRDMFSALAAELAGPAAAGLTACQLEDLLDERGRAQVPQLFPQRRAAWLRAGLPGGNPPAEDGR